jgi:hypothetical protein
MEDKGEMVVLLEFNPNMLNSNIKLYRHEIEDNDEMVAKL